MNPRRFLLLTLSVVTLAGCTPPSDGETSAASATSSSVMGTGLYYAAVSPQSATWIETINLHADGTFEGSFGDSVSNNSGFLSYVDGTYAVDEHASTLTVTPAGGTSFVYDLKAVDGGVQVTAADGGGGDAPFTLTKGPRPASLTFTADWNISGSGALVPDAPLLIEYAASRSPCPVSSSTSDPSVVLEMIVDGEFSEVSVYKLPSRAQGAYYRVLTSVPSGHTMTLWFENETIGSNGEATCSSWDSNFGDNYDFAIAN